MSCQHRICSVTRPVIAAVLVWAGTVGPASAVHEPARLGLTPVDNDGTYFSLTMEPGEARRLQVEAANFGHSPIVARTYAADAYSIVNGGFGADLFGERPTGTTRWLTYPAREVTLAPEDALLIDFDVAIPADIPPGEYITAIVIENATPVRGSGSISVDQVNRSAIAVAIEIPGQERPALSIGSVHHKEVAGSSVVSFEVINQGNRHLRPAGDFVLRDGNGAGLAAHPVEMDSVYAGTTTTLEAPAVEALVPGDYCAQLTLTDSATGARDATECLPFTVAPDEDGAPFGGLPDAAAQVAASLGDQLSSPVAIIPLVLGAGGIVVLIARRRQSRVGAAAWQGGTAASVPTAGEEEGKGLSALIAPLRTLLGDHPEITRGWVLDDNSEVVLAVEGPRGANPAGASRLSTTLQERIDRELRPPVPIRVVCLQGAGPVARVTGHAVPFYERTGER